MRRERRRARRSRPIREGPPEREGEADCSVKVGEPSSEATRHTEQRGVSSFLEGEREQMTLTFDEVSAICKVVDGAMLAGLTGRRDIVGGCLGCFNTLVAGLYCISYLRYSTVCRLAAAV